MTLFLRSTHASEHFSNAEGAQQQPFCCLPAPFAAAQDCLVLSGTVEACLFQNRGLLVLFCLNWEHPDPHALTSVVLGKRKLHRSAEGSRSLYSQPLLTRLRRIWQADKQLLSQHHLAPDRALHRSYLPREDLWVTQIGEHLLLSLPETEQAR